MKSILLILTQIFLLFGCLCSASNLLLLTPLGSKSQHNAFMGMFKPLTERGHKLTVVSAYGSSSKDTKYIKNIVLPAKFGASSFVRKVFTDGTSGPMFNLLTKSPQMCVDSLSTDLIQDLKKEKFDLIMLSAFMSECYLSLVHYFKVPLVYMSPIGIVGLVSESAGNPYFVSLSGNTLLEGTHPFGYIYRLKATVLDAVMAAFMKYHGYWRAEKLCRESGHCPPDMPGFSEIRANASIVIANSVKLLEPNKAPDMPHIVYAGGSHCGPAKPLPEDLEKWVQSSGEHGFIFFSLGSAVTPSDMPESWRKIFLNVFGRLKQKVLWKWDKEMDDLPSNVKVGKWLPQQDILAHPKLRVFISHGGLHSVMETTYHGARIIGMPLFGDQYTNIKEGVTDGWAESLFWDELTEESLERKIYSVFNNNRMDAAVAHRSKIMRDQPRSPKENVIYWIEYVIRHKGAPHLRSPLHDMPLYVLYNADVWLTIFAFLVGSLASSFLTFRAVFRYCFRKSKSTNKKKKKH